MIKVHGWAADSAGCQSYRIRWPADAINRIYGDEITYEYGTEMDREQRETADVVIGQRVVLPGPSHFWKQWSRDGSKRLIMEMDDDLFTVHESNLRASHVFNKSEVQKRLTNNILMSDAVTVSTPALRDAVHRSTGFPLDRIYVVPNALPKQLLNHRLSVGEGDHRPTVGWMCSPTHRADAEMVGRYLRRFLEANPETTYHGIGADYTTLMKLPENQVRTTHWIRSPEDAVRKIDYHIGICPLTKSVFNKSKSDCKWLELAARGVPGVVSDSEAYATVEHGVTGLRVKRDHEWTGTLKRLYDDPALQKDLADNAYAYVRDHRTTDQTAALWRDVIVGGGS